MDNVMTDFSTVKPNDYIPTNEISISNLMVVINAFKYAGAVTAESDNYFISQFRNYCYIVWRGMNNNLILSNTAPTLNYNKISMKTIDNTYTWMARTKVDYSTQDVTAEPKEPETWYPPLDTECHMARVANKLGHSKRWLKVTVAAYHQGYAWVFIEGERPSSHKLDLVEFKPYETPRELTITELSELMEEYKLSETATNAYDVCATLYDKHGLRIT